MIKKTLKNVRRLKWFTFFMWLIANGLTIELASHAAKGHFENAIGLAITLLVIIMCGWLFWFYGFNSYVEIEQEMIDAKRNNK
jgi:hypothetical protein